MGRRKAAKSSVVRGGGKVGNYIHSGGFNRLAGLPEAPGSLRPEKVIRRWRYLYLAIGGAFLLTGMFFVIF